LQGRSSNSQQWRSETAHWQRLSEDESFWFLLPDKDLDISAWGLPVQFYIQYAQLELKALKDLNYMSHLMS
jgi:hypothetical protein